MKLEFETSSAPEFENCPVIGCRAVKDHDSFGPENGWHISINNTSFRDPNEEVQLCLYMIVPHFPCTRGPNHDGNHESVGYVVEKLGLKGL